MTIVRDNAARFATHVPVVIVGAGACGAMSALSARAMGVDVLMLERDATPAGSTALSSGFIPAAGTRVQRAAGIDDAPGRFAADIQAKAHGRADAALVAAYTQAAPFAIDALNETHGIAFELLDGFLYPGHSVPRMHAVRERTGVALLAQLHRAAAESGADLLTEATVTDLIVDDTARVRGVRFVRPDGRVESVGCDALMLACCGFGADRELVAQHVPALASAEYFGHEGNRGSALSWGEALGAATADLSAAQGHGSLAVPQRALITWALMMQGAIQVNVSGRRFANEHDGYSEAAVRVLAQPGGVAFVIYDARLHDVGLTFPDYASAAQLGAVKHGATAVQLAQELGIDAAGLRDTLAEVIALGTRDATDQFGRRFRSNEILSAPYCGVRVTGALFHTQGGLAIDAQCRVLARDGRVFPNLFPNLFAAGGAARGVSGDSIDGYLSGNGLLSAVAGGFIAGRRAAELVLSR